MERFGRTYVRRVKRKKDDVRISEFGSKKARVKKLKNGMLGDQEVDNDYDWLLLNLLIETTELTKVITRDDQIEFVNKNEKGNEDEDENGNQGEDEDENYKDSQYCMFLENLTVNGISYKLKISQNDKESRFLYYEQLDDSDWCDDLQTCTDNIGDEVTVSEDMQLNQKPNEVTVSEDMQMNQKPDEVTVSEDMQMNQKPDEVTVSEDMQMDQKPNEATVPVDMQINQKPKRRLNEKKREVSSKKEVSRRKISNHKSKEQTTNQAKTADPCYKLCLNICSKYGAAKLKEQLVEYAKNDDRRVQQNSHIRRKRSAVKVKREDEFVEHEKNATTSDSDSDSDSDIMIWDNVQNCSEVNSKQKKLREKLMDILKQPYNEKEYEELSGYVEQEKPVCRLLPLRGRSISSALGRAKKSLLDYGPGSFRRVYKVADSDRPKALNLLRMFRFWLEHVPNEDVFEPWKDKHIMNVQPSEKNASNGYDAAAAAAVDLA